MTALAYLAKAIAEDHPCSDAGCDIATALAHGYVKAAAILLLGATETPAVDAVFRKYSGLDLGGLHDPPFQAWVVFHREYGRKCPECESYTYADPDTDFEPALCTNCLSPLGTEESGK